MEYDSHFSLVRQTVDYELAVMISVMSAVAVDATLGNAEWKVEYTLSNWGILPRVWTRDAPSMRDFPLPTRKKRPRKRNQ